MGFTLTSAAAVASALPHAYQAYALNKQAKSLRNAANAQEQLANRQASAITEVAQANQRRGALNAQARLASARADAAASNLAEDGSAHARESDLAARLQDEISANANAALSRADAVRQQGAFDAWNTRNAAARAKSQAFGSALSSAGSLLSGIASSLSPAGKSSAKK